MRDNCFYNQFPFRDVRWSSDNTQLAAHVIDTRFVNSDQIFLVKVDIPNCDTTGLVRLDRIPGPHITFEGDSKRIESYDWDGQHRFLLNDSIRSDWFGNLYLYDSNTKEAVMLNPLNGECCYRDARWSPDGKYIFFVFQRSGTRPSSCPSCQSTALRMDCRCAQSICLPVSSPRRVKSRSPP